MNRLVHGVEHALAHRAMVGVAFVLGVVVTFPAVLRGWKIDDFLHRSLLIGDGQRLGLLATMCDYFAFIVPEKLRSRRKFGPSLGRVGLV